LNLAIELEENYNLRVPRNIPKEQAEEHTKVLKIKLETLLADDRDEIWFEDESGFEKIAGTNHAEISSDSWKRYQLCIGKLWNRGKKSKLTIYDKIF